MLLLILLLFVVLLLVGGGYGYQFYGYPGAGGAVLLFLAVLLVLWALGVLG